MSVTAVPLSTISSASKAKLFAGLAALVLAGGVLAYVGTEKLVKASLPASAFLEKNAEAEGVQVTSSGLQYKVLGEGEGPRPTARDIVLVHYEGRLTDGTVFRSEEHTSELQSLMRISYAVFCLKTTINSIHYS